ncbi:MAG: hypothetical protein ABEH86_11795 [Haloarcula sp.]
MPDDATEYRALTRRDHAEIGCGLLGSGLLADCLGDSMDSPER